MTFTSLNGKKASRRSPLKVSPLRVPGQSLHEEINRVYQRFDDRILPGVILMSLTGFEWYRLWVGLGPNPWPLTILTFIILPYIVWAIRKHRAVMANLKLGLDGERTVGHALEELRVHGYRVFHDLQGSSFNIDHVIAGPTGIYTIETKTLSKPAGRKSKIIYDGCKIRRDDGSNLDEHLSQARAQANWLTEVINLGRTRKYSVRAVVLFPGWWVENIAGLDRQRDVWVLNDKALSHWLANEPEKLSPDSLDTIANCITQYCNLTANAPNAVA